MPATKIIYFKEGETVPVLEWLNELKRHEMEACAKCFVRIQLLK